MLFVLELKATDVYQSSHWPVPGRQKPTLQNDSLLRQHEYAPVRDDSAGQIQRIGGGKHHGLARWRRVAHGAQQLNCNGQTELLARKAIHKVAAVHFAAVFHTAKHLQHIAPLQLEAFTCRWPTLISSELCRPVPPVIA